MPPGTVSAFAQPLLPFRRSQVRDCFKLYLDTKRYFVRLYTWRVARGLELPSSPPDMKAMLRTMEEQEAESECRREGRTALGLPGGPRA
jgi:hypothetical protein